MSNNVSQKTQVYFGQYLNKVFKPSVEVVYIWITIAIIP